MQQTIFLLRRMTVLYLSNFWYAINVSGLLVMSLLLVSRMDQAFVTIALVVVFSVSCSVACVTNGGSTWNVHNGRTLVSIKGDLRTICRFSYMKVYKLITLGTKFKTLLSLGRKITMFSKFITNYIEQGWWHSSLTLKCMHLLLKEVNKRGRHAYNLHGWTCLPSGIVMEIHCHITGIFEAAVRLRLPSCCSV